MKYRIATYLAALRPSLFVCALFLGLAAPCQAVPETIGPLENPGNFDTNSFSGYINYDVDLDTQTYDIRLPSNFNSNETYGLVTWINSGPSGVPLDVWTPVLDKYRLIWIGGDNIQNSAQEKRRRGVALMGAFRMTELYTIDTNRVYGAGRSGGGRSISSLAFMRDDFIKGVATVVGHGFPEDLPSDFSTTLATNYEYEIFPGGTSLEESTEARVSMQTFYNSDINTEGDGREDEHITIYHLGYVNNGNIAQLVEYPGDHYTLREEAFEESIRFMENRRALVIDDDFGNGVLATNPSGSGSGWYAAAGTVIETSVPGVSSGVVNVVELSAGSEIRSVDAFDWNDDFGMSLDTSLRTDTNAHYNQRMQLALIPANTNESARIEISMEQTGVTNKSVRISLVDRSGVETELCRFAFGGADEPMNRATNDRAYFQRDGVYEAPGYNFRGLDLRWQMDDTHFQINFRQNIDSLTFVSTNTVIPVKLLRDRWTVLGVWEDLGLEHEILGMKPVKQWRVALANEKLIEANPANGAMVPSVRVVNHKAGWTPATDGSESQGTVFIQDNGPEGLVSWEAEHYERQEIQGLHAWTFSTTQAGHSGTGAVEAAENIGTAWDTEFEDRSPRLDYYVAFTNAGDHYVWVRGYAATTNDHSCHIGINGIPMETADRLGGFTTGAYTWQNATLDGASAAVIQIPGPGIHRVSLWMRDDGFIADKLLLTTDPAYTPTGSGPTESTTRDLGLPDEDGDGIPDNQDPDADGDTLLNIDEGMQDTDGDGKPDFLDTDSDNDGLDDQDEGLVDSDGDGIVNLRDTDSDNDTIPDGIDGTGDPDGDFLANFLDDDSDGDGLLDRQEYSQGPGLELWFDASDITQLVQSGGMVTHWANRLTSGTNLTTQSGAPVLDEINGLSSVRFTSDIMTADDVFGGASEEMTVLFVSQENVGSDNRFINLNGEDDSAFGRVAFSTPWNGNRNWYWDCSGSNFERAEISAPPIAVGEAALVSATQSTADDFNELRLFGGAYSNLSTKSTTATTVGGLRIGTDTTDHELGELMVFSRKLAADELEFFEGYLAHKWLLTSMLPSNHTYKTTAPGTLDSDGDGTPDFLDTDSDDDGLDDQVEGLVDSDGDGIANFRDTDSDNDTIPDGIDGTGDPDGDSLANYLDDDSDGDGLLDSQEYKTTAPGWFVNDFDEDGTPNFLDTDSDGDGISDADECGLCGELVNWFDASDTNQLVVSGGTVTHWADRSASGSDLTTQSGAPVLGEINGLSSVRFTSDIMTAGDLFGGSSEEMTVLFVSQENVGSNNRFINLNGDESSADERVSFHTPWNGNRNWYWDCSGSNFERAEISAPPIAVGEAALVSATQSTADDFNELRLFGGAYSNLSTKSTTATTVGGLRIGTDTTDHELGELMVFNRKLAAAELEFFEGYLAHKWLLTSMLPSNHTYKVDAPGPVTGIDDPDGDSIPNYFDTDSDNDGFVDLHEFLAGTDPIDDTSFLGIDGVRPVSTNLYELTWSGVPGKSYRVLSTTNLLQSIWMTNEVGIAGVNPVTVTTNMVDAVNAYFILELEN